MKEIHVDFNDCANLGEALAKIREHFAEIAAQMDRHAADLMRNQGFPTEEEIAGVQIWQRKELEKERLVVERQIAAFFLDPKAESPADTLQ